MMVDPNELEVEEEEAISSPVKEGTTTNSGFGSTQASSERHRTIEDDLNDLNF